MSAFSDYYENAIIDHMLRNQVFTPPTTLYVALFTADTGLEANNPSVEVTGGAYARQIITLTAAAAGASDNTADIIFPTASASWGSVTQAAIVDHISAVDWGIGVNVLMWADLTAPKTVSTNDVFKFLLGEFDVVVQ